MDWLTVINLIESISLMSMAIYIALKFRYSDTGLRWVRSGGFRQTTMYVLVFGLLSIYGGLAAVPLLSGFISIRHVGVVCAGFLGGPPAGTVVGLIAGAHRLLMGGNTAVSAACAAVVIGVAVDFWRRWRPWPGRITVTEAAVATALLEGLWIFITAFVAGDKRLALQMLNVTAIPMILANTAGVACVIALHNSISDEYGLKADKRVMASELAVAAKVQKSLLPEISADWPHDWEFAVLFKPVWEVGGDFYDCYQLDEGRWCVVIGDVAGKGVSASLFMAAIQAYLQLLVQSRTRASQILASLNDELCRRNRESMFATLALLIVDTRTGEVNYSLAGHNSMVHTDNLGGVREMGAGRAMAIGALPGVHYHDAGCQLGWGEMLVLYTDGVSEAMNGRGEL
ncbi:MAG: SpoIIE family protein phosphatase, partial [Negativicutes bacterium]|nr:SpoIIE family protein phosphatase [Negativicutes bacterium]